MSNPHGWRRYKLVARPDGFYLAGYRMDWPSHTMRSACLSGYAPKPSPEREQQFLEHSLSDKPACSIDTPCGIYMVRDRADLVKAVPGLGPIDAGCVGWGLTGVYRLGWRPQWVRIEYLELREMPRWTDGELLGREAQGVDPETLLAAALEQIAERYQVPVEVRIKQAA